MKLVILQREHGIRWDDIDVIADDRQTLVGHQHRHGRLLRQEFRQQTLVNRIQVLNHHIGHSAVGWQGGQKLRDGL